MPRIILALTMTLWLAASSGPASALTVLCANCSETWTQQMERVTSLEQLRSLLNTYHEAIQQTQQQIELVRNNIQQYQNMVQNTLNLPRNLLNQVTGQFSDLARLINTVKLLKGDILGMSEVFNETYPELELIKNIARGDSDKSIKEIWEIWSKETDRAAEATFQVTGQQLKDLAENSDDLDRHISDLLSTPEGQMQALQSGNSLAAIQIDEMRKLRTMMAVSIQSATQAMMKEEKREQLSVEHREFLLDKSGLASQYQGYK
ncbi:MAG: P-type conjugative transfer protein TrbJ [Deltaproteobacteria bacterium]|nr:P-type conjugative transfer protein TrbJ [Deltaproteobacteria bacterium]